MKKYLEIYFKNLEKIMEIWNFVSPKKWEPWVMQWPETKLSLSSFPVIYKVGIVVLLKFENKSD